ncbi:MAG: hypothetical protein ACP5VC_14450, partial [Bryobacteraceae bacterium]
RAVYNSLAWLHDLPLVQGEPDRLQLGAMLAYQMERQADKPMKARARELAGKLAEEAAQHSPQALDRLRTFLCVAEFLAREQRASRPARQAAGVEGRQS